MAKKQRGRPSRFRWRSDEIEITKPLDKPLEKTKAPPKGIPLN